MPEFVLNISKSNRIKLPHPFHDLNPFAKGYIEAVFFADDDDTGSINALGVERITRDSIKNIKAVCAKFESENEAKLCLCYEQEGYDACAAGRDFWYTRNGHGVGFWSRDELAQIPTVRDNLSDVAEGFGNSYFYSNNGWIYFDC